MEQSLAADVAAVQAIEAVPKILQVVTQSTGLRFACVARVTAESWTACAVLDGIGLGLQAGDGLELSTTLCDKVRNTNTAVIIDKASEDPLYHNHVTPKMYGFESYISVPIYRSGGGYFGSLCALDPLPAQLNNARTLSTLTLFAELISLQLESEQRLGESRDALLSAQESAELREQFIAVLGHDLRTPLASILAGAAVLQKKGLDEKAAAIVGSIRQSGQRISMLIDDVLDFARGRLGGGIALRTRQTDTLRDDLAQVVSELQSAFPDTRIECEMDIASGIECDPVRLAQLLANLLTNALTHGTPGQTVQVHAMTTEGAFVLAVRNHGPTIAPEVQPHLFKPYRRGANKNPATGLGLELYIAHEIARSHGGTLGVQSANGATSFTFTLPTGCTAGSCGTAPAA
ncbi:Bacteriophytochrome [Andreprevotia sp. IGB-42]|uniref:GAF domain-containing sensor histidine kinase n=1 Tax=Andreprevotia sp. IGB-42 TaxID=2497473 RepID=UPI00135C7C1B|nr:GAF domain-containing sensor histidine kinase [Andreprevotia sp. IGB-42]KAF0813270.1 Bacteriophytochrome [Andreprevotia sp. IGB-42]